ncbi:MAG: hypothetical protein M3Z35_15655 [Nitrospirota bacterium]|nr:hypothetical protein [Nitrospirota bacterium]
MHAFEPGRREHYAIATIAAVARFIALSEQDGAPIRQVGFGNEDQSRRL